MNCYGCDAELEPVFEPPGEKTDYQFDNVLWITFDGGYGMFVDPIDHEWVGSPHPYKIVICHECAHELCEKVPWVEKLLESNASHSHRADYIQNHPDHHGWDLKPRLKRVK